MALNQRLANIRSRMVHVNNTNDYTNFTKHLSNFRDYSTTLIFINNSELECTLCKVQIKAPLLFTEVLTHQNAKGMSFLTII